MNSYKQISNTFNIIPTYMKVMLSFIISLGLAFILGVQDLYVHGLLIGTVFALGAIGITLLYAIVKFAHVAHGDFMTLAAYIAFPFAVSVVKIEYVSYADNFSFTGLFPLLGLDQVGLWIFTFGLPTLLAIPFAMIILASIAVLLEIFVYRKLRNRGSSDVMLAMSSFGIAILLRGIVQTIFGTQLRSFDRISKPFLDLGLGIAVPPDLIFLGLTAIFLCFITHYILQYTKIGKSMRATSDNPDLAMVTGINVNKVIINTWILAACLAACAGILVSIFSAQFMPQMGWKLLIPIFAAVVLGGVGNAYGAFIGALIVGISMEVSTEYINPAYKLAIAFIIMLLVLLVKPRGLLGGKD
mgnify:FL=1